MLKTIVLVKLHAQRRFPLSFVLSFFTICACNLIYIARQSHMHLHHNIAELLLLLQNSSATSRKSNPIISSILFYTHTLSLKSTPSPSLLSLLDWSKGKVSPLVSSIRARLRPRPTPLNMFQDLDGLPRIILTDPTGSSAEVLLYGGQIVSWKNEQKQELLFKSSKANWKQPKAIRGGISVCFPQFGNMGSLDQQGFTRNRLWSLDKDPSPLPPPDNHSSVDLIFKSTREDLKIWPRSFELRLRITLSAGKLVLIPRVRNTDNKPLSFTLALCNYLTVSDISEVRIEGLETLDYLDNLVKRSRFTEQADAITFDGEVDRVYLRTPSKIAIIDHEKKRTYELKKNGMADAVVWNPWERKAKAMNDMGDEDYQSMISLSCAVIENPVTLKPGEEWKGHQELSTVSSSYCSGQLDPRKVIYGFH